jgi:Questin oxidase-like
MAMADYSRHDEALGLLAGLGADLTNGMTSHVPMVAEALCAMGEAAAAVAWVGGHRKTVVPRGVPSRPIAAETWRTSLGQHWRFADWSAFFAREIACDGWRAACDQWVGRLAPGFPAAATHGVIRVGHAARALHAGETPLRLQEFADGLALWASTYVELPATRTASARLSPAAALARVPLVAEEKRQNSGAITIALAQLVHAPGFDGVLDLIDTERPAAETALEAAEAFARVAVANVHSPLTAIVFTHGVTGMAAALNLLPHVSAATGRTLVAYAWQSGAALMSAYAKAPFDGAAPVAPLLHVDRVARAVAHGDDHVIKLTEACLSLNAVRPSTVFLAAADRVVAHLPEVRT